MCVSLHTAGGLNFRDGICFYNGEHELDLERNQSNNEESTFHPFVPAPGEFVSLAEMEDALLRNLFQGYQRWVRPIQRANDTIKVRFGLKISQLVDVVRLNAHSHTHFYENITAFIYCHPTNLLH